MNIIEKGLIFFKTAGFINTIKKIAYKIYKETKKLPFVIYEIVYTKNAIKRLKVEFRDKDVYIIIPGIDWSIPLFQRPHQIATELSKRDNTLVLFLPDQYQYDNFAIYKKIDENLWLYSIRVAKYINNLLEYSNTKIIFMSWTRHANLLNDIKYDKLVYEYIDEMSLFYFYNEQMEQIHRGLMQQANLTVCTAIQLYNKAKQFTNRIMLSENAGDYSFFKDNRIVPIAQELAGVTENYTLVIGYYGCLAYWFDYDIICKVAKQKRDWLFVLVGYEFDHSSDVLKTGEYENILLIPSQPYTKLPNYVAGFDIQIIPFVINEVTKSTSPVKLFEYMASGKPIITSKLPECLRYKSVLTYDTADDFIELVNQAIRLDKADEYFSIMEEEALANTWKSRVDVILENLKVV